MRGFREIKAGARVALPPLRAARLPAFVGPRPVPADEALATTAVAVIGVGAVGADFALQLGRLQPRLIALIDPTSVKPTTILTGCGFLPSDRGSKVAVIGRRVKALSPATQVIVFAGAVQQLSLDALLTLAVDVVILAGDNLECELAVGQLCQAMGLPLLHSAVEGPSLVAQVRFHSETCPACSWGALERKLLHQQIQFSCEGNRVKVDSVATMSTPHLCSSAASLCLNQLMRWRLGLGKTAVADTMIEYCGYTNQMVTSPLKRNPDCLCDHTRYKLVSIPKAVADCSLEEIACAAGLNGEAWTIALPGMKWVERLACRCHELKKVARFAPASGFVGRCPHCGAPRKAHPHYSFENLASAKAGPSLKSPLRQLGAGVRTPFAVIRTETATFYVRSLRKEAP
jgi:molybdopterin/thiamine biosynthesis adenylyltransferase